jgi:hypothetical protein
VKYIAILTIVTCGWAVPLRAAGGPLDARVTIDYRNAPGAAVIMALGQSAGLNVQVAPGTLRPVTITLTAVRLSNALNALCDNALCLWRLEAGVLRITPLPNEGSAALPARVSFELHDTPATDVFIALAAAIDVPVTIEPGLPAEPVSFNFKNAPTAEVLNILCNVQRCDWEFDPARGLRVTQKR